MNCVFTTIMVTRHIGPRKSKTDRPFAKNSTGIRLTTRRVDAATSPFLMESSRVPVNAASLRRILGPFRGPKPAGRFIALKKD